MIYLNNQVFVDNDMEMDHIGSHLGKAYGIVNVIRSSIHLIPKREILIPHDILSKVSSS
jgi:hypothetical protein